MECAAETPTSPLVDIEKPNLLPRLDLSEVLDEQVCLKFEKCFLANLKRKLGMTYGEIARELGLHRVYVGHIFRGRYPLKIFFLKKLGIFPSEIWEEINAFGLDGSKKEFQLPRQIPLTAEFAWLLGYWLGDKNSANDGVGVTDTSLIVLSEFVRVLEKLGINRNGLRVYVDYRGAPDFDYIAKHLKIPKENFVHVSRTCKTLTVTVMFYSRLWARIFSKIAEKVGILLDNAPPNVKGAFVGGFIDAEGDCKNNIMIGQASMGPLVVVTKILRDLGFKVEKIKFSHHLFYVNISPIGGALSEFLKFIKLVNPRKRKDAEHLIYHVKHLRRERILSSQIIGFMGKTGCITIKDAAKKFNLPYHTAKYAFQRLRKRGLIRKVGKKEKLILFSLVGAQKTYR